MRRHTIIKKQLSNKSTIVDKPIITKYSRIQYEEPIIKDMAIILVYFNPTNSIRIIQNILFVKNSLEICKIPFYIAELAFNDEPYLFTRANNIFQYRTTSYMFYKENLIYSILKFLPDTIIKICTLDADIMYDNPKWYEIISNTLNTYNVCQPYNIAFRLNIDFTVYSYAQSCIDASVNYSTGFAWAFKKDWFINNGFFEYAVIGGGDSIFYKYVMFHIQSTIYKSKIYNDEYSKYLKTREKSPPVCSINLNIYHLFHGLLDNRQYSTRHGLFEIKINSLNLSNISELFIRRDDNILEWNPKFKNEMNTFMKTYFMNRQDDSV